MSRLWKRVTGLCKGVNINVQQFFGNLTNLFPIKVNLRATLTLTQAVYAQASAITIVGQIVRKYPACPVWNFVRSRCPAEYQMWVQAMQALSANLFAAMKLWTQDTIMFEARHFQSLLAAAMTLDMMMDHNSTLRGYGGRTNTSMQARIAQICIAYL